MWEDNNVTIVSKETDKCDVSLSNFIFITFTLK